MSPIRWLQAARTIPQLTAAEWQRLDLVSRWLVASRAAVLIMTFLSAAIAGLFAWRDGAFRWVPWLALTLGLLLAHASNNILNDFTDFVRGVDRDNYYRNVYGVQPLASGLMSKREHLGYFAVTAVLALVLGIYVITGSSAGALAWLLLGLGAFFLLFYTWPLKGLALGELAVLLVWGPLMIGGGYAVLAGHWSWDVATGSLPYVLGVTTVIFGKHIDKLDMDREKGIRTLPVLIGERAARHATIAMMLAPYPITLGLIAQRFFTPVMAVVLLALPHTLRHARVFLQPKLATPPAGQVGWPLFFVAHAFLNNRRFGVLFLSGLLVDVVLRKLPFTAGLVDAWGG